MDATESGIVINVNDEHSEKQQCLRNTRESSKITIADDMQQSINF
jgi:hypothetical protein